MLWRKSKGETVNIEALQFLTDNLRKHLEVVEVVWPIMLISEGRVNEPSGGNSLRKGPEAGCVPSKGEQQ